MYTIKLSKKGQIVLPCSIRLARRWKPGMEFTIDDRPDGILLRPVKPFPETKVADVIGSAGYKGSRRTLKEMENAILRGARKRR